jgi:hypothetical protein
LKQAKAPIVARAPTADGGNTTGVVRTAPVELALRFAAEPPAARTNKQRFAGAGCGRPAGDLDEGVEEVEVIEAKGLAGARQGALGNH